MRAGQFHVLLALRFMALTRPAALCSILLATSASATSLVSENSYQDLGLEGLSQPEANVNRRSVAVSRDGALQESLHSEKGASLLRREIQVSAHSNKDAREDLAASGSQQDAAFAKSTPVNCAWTEWAEWSACPVSCGGTPLGSFRETRRTQKPEAAHGGTECVGVFSMKQACSSAPCPIDCVWNSWGDWANCSTTCGLNGTTQRTRGFLVYPEYGGAHCKGNDTSHTSCNVVDCPVDCVWGEWEEWSTCTEPCGGGIQQARRLRSQHAMFGGRECTSLTHHDSHNASGNSTWKPGMPLTEAGLENIKRSMIQMEPTAIDGTNGTANETNATAISASERTAARLRAASDWPDLRAQSCNTDACNATEDEQAHAHFMHAVLLPFFLVFLFACETW